MVISDKYKYLFLELHYTGSTAISKELVEMYDGYRILKKHARYNEFLKNATKEQKSYFVFSGIRNPMDMIVSEYVKCKENHKGRYTTPSEWRRNGGTLSDKHLRIYKDITNNNLSFEQYFTKYYKVPYDNWSRLAHKKFDNIIRFENISQDFETTLQLLNIPIQRPLPRVNKTSNKKSFIEYYTPEIQKHAVFIFGPFMKKWGYSFPVSWKNPKVSLFSIFLYRVIGVVRSIYWTITYSKSSPPSKSETKSVVEN